MIDTIAWPTWTMPKKPMIGAALAAIVLATTLVVAPVPLPLTAAQVAKAHDPPEVCTTTYDIRYAGVTADGTRYGRYTVPVTSCQPGPHGSHSLVEEVVEVFKKGARQTTETGGTIVAGAYCGPICGVTVAIFIIGYYVIPRGENPQCNPAETGIRNCAR